MKYKWLNKLNSNNLIVFFNGWGMDENAVSHLNCEDFDVVMLYDYNDLSLDLNFDSYNRIHVVSWSMGVMIATLFDFKNTVSSTAICGTPVPINNIYGIPERIYNYTLKGFNKDSSKKFTERMVADNHGFEIVTKRPLTNQKSELEQLLNYEYNPNYKFSRVIVAKKDVIIPTNNQLNYWKKIDIEPEQIDTGHYPFHTYKKWTELI